MVVKVSLLVILNIIFFAGGAFAQSWKQLSTTNNPSARRNASAVYDPFQHRMIVFGGVDATGNKNDIWSLSLSTLAWSLLTPSTGNLPDARFSHNAMIDTGFNRMLIWSGQGSGLYNDVWAFNFLDSAWIQLWANGNVSGAPLTRYGTGAIYDVSKNRLVNYAGFTSSGRFQDTWYFETDSIVWREQTKSITPGLRCLHSVCFAPELRKMVMYGGQRSGPLDDIWALDVDSFDWTDLTPTTKPDARYFSSVVYAGNGKVFMFGGQTASGPSGELWQFSLSDNSWTQISQGSVKPTPRQGHAAIYVPSSNKMVIFSGTDGSLFNDSWEFSLSTTSFREFRNQPIRFSLDQNFPNPFNPTTRIGYNLSEPGLVSLKVFDLLGREVASLLNTVQNIGHYETVFNAALLPAGVYLYRLQQGNFVETRRMILVK